MHKAILTLLSGAALLAAPGVALATDSGAAAGAATGAAAGAAVGGPVGAAVGAGVGGAAGGAATGPNRDVVIEKRGTGSVGCSTTTKQSSDATGTTTKQRTDC